MRAQRDAREGGWGQRQAKMCVLVLNEVSKPRDGELRQDLRSSTRRGMSSRHPEIRLGTERRIALIQDDVER